MSPGHPTKPRWHKAARVVLSAVVTVGLLAWVFGRVDRQELFDLVGQAQVGWLALAALLIPVEVLLLATRWRRIAQDLGMPMSRGYAVREYALSTFLNQVLPGGISGDVVRVWRHRSGHGSVGAPLRAAVVDRFIGQSAQLLVTLLGLLLWNSVHGDATRPTGALVVVLVALGVFAVGLFVPVRLMGLGKLAQDAREALSSPRRILFHGLISFALLAAFLLGFTFCALAFDRPLGLAAITAIPLVMLPMVIPFSVGGWGLREASAAAVLAHIGWPPAAALALSAAYGLSVLAGALPGVSVLFFREPDTGAS